MRQVRHFRLSITNARNSNLNLSCSKACIDPTNTFVIGLHNVLGIPASSLSRNNNNQHVTLDLFHFKENCNLVSSLQYDGTHGGSSNCFHCSNLDSSKLLVGARDGSLLLWDLSSSSSSAPQ